jgi:hypothetical protein
MAKQMEIAGTERPRITEIEEAADAYVSIRDKRMNLTVKEIAAREALVTTVQAHKSELTPNGAGEYVYRYDDDLEVVLKPGKEKVKVRHASTDDEDEDDE